MIPGSANPLLLAAEAGPYQIERSLRFNSSDSAYLSKTFASAGNRQSWTWSGWVKRSSLTGTTSRQILFSGYIANSDTGFLEFGFNATTPSGTADTFFCGSWSIYSQSAAVFRDVSAWYHIVVSYNGANIKAYVNNVEILSWARTGDLAINSAGKHSIGALDTGSLSRYFSGYLADVHFIDGQALDPTSFTEVDATTGQLVPIEYTGSYGTNGFYLPFSDNSTAAALGTDTSGNGNDWTVNNLVAGPATTADSWSGYFDGTGDYLSWSGTTLSGDFTVECWVYKTATDASGYTNVFSSLSVNNQLAFDNTTAGTIYLAINGTEIIAQSGTAVTPNTWHHLAWVREGSTCRAYVDGIQQGTGTSSASMGIDIIGRYRSGGYEMNGYISNARITNACLYPGGTTFTPSTSPLTTTVSSGTVQLLTLQDSTFIDNSSNNFTITANGNTSTSTSSPFEESSDTDSLVDTPTNYGTDTGAGGEVRGNYCTWNALDANATLANGNLETSAPAGYRHARCTIAMPPGKWYAEFTTGAMLNGTSTPRFGVNDNTRPLTDSDWQSGGYGIDLLTSQNTSYAGKFSASAGVTVLVTQSVTLFNTGDVVGIAYDADTGKIWFSRNGTWLYSGNPTSGTTPVAQLDTTKALFFHVEDYSSGSTANFGQRPFAYTAPSGFKALCTANLDDPVVAQPSTVMDVKLYTGNGSTQTISGLGFSPDLVWIKSRVGTANHVLTDSVRGAALKLTSNTTGAEAGTDNGYLSAFTSDGFTVAQGGGLYPGIETNYNPGTPYAYAAWCWDAGSSTVTNTDGTITSQVRANPSAGFSIVNYINASSVTASVGHGLGVAPAFIITKQRFATLFQWTCLHTSIGTNYLLLNSTSAQTVNASVWPSVPSNTVFNLGTGFANGSEMIAYCFAPVAGYSAFGSYTGNGSADGTFVFTGHRPRWILLKRTDTTSNWTIIDTAREGYNVDNDPLYPNLANAEGTTDLADILSNGFKLRSTDASVNANAGTYIYASFAEQPFSLARAR